LSVYVNGNKVPTNVDYRSIKLNAHDEIAIIYGVMPFDKIPLRYEFPQGLWHGEDMRGAPLLFYIYTFPT
jgi:hypothetical protein